MTSLNLDISFNGSFNAAMIKFRNVNLYRLDTEDEQGAGDVYGVAINVAGYSLTIFKK